MDVEIVIKLGKRSVSDCGEVTWSNADTRSAIVTLTASPIGAKAAAKEIAFHCERALKQYVAEKQHACAAR